MTNPNPYFCADIELIAVMGLPVSCQPPKIRFLKNDSIRLRASFRLMGIPLYTAGMSVSMTIGASQVEGVAYNHATGSWDFAVGAAITQILEAGVQDVSFVITKGDEQTFVRIPDAIEPIAII